MLNFYAHSISAYRSYELSDLEKLEQIFKSGYLLSRRKLNLSEKDALFNGMDYISLCDLSKKSSAYRMYIECGLSLLFDKKVKAVKPLFVSVDYNRFPEDIMHYYGSIGRYSDLSDEVQVKDELSLAYLRGISLSLRNIRLYHSEDYIINYLIICKNLLEEYNIDVPIINLDNETVFSIDKARRLVKNIC